MLLVFGSLNMDLAMVVDHLPKPGETVLGPSYVLVPGGKGANQAVAAARAGGHVQLVGTVGNDEFGRSVIAGLKRHSVDITGVATGTRPTGCAAILIDAQAENLIGVASGANLETNADQVDDRWLGPGVTILLQMEVEPEQNWALAARAKARGARVALNLAPARAMPLAALKNIDMLTMNEHEAAVLSKSIGAGDQPAKTVAQALADKMGMTTVITLGSKGAMVVAPKEIWMVDPMPIQPVDTTGAGDTFCGAFAAALDRRLTLQAALERANIAAGLACLQPGAQEGMPSRTQIEEKLLSGPRSYRPG